jgi:hypothetical protein
MSSKKFIMIFGTWHFEWGKWYVVEMVMVPDSRMGVTNST